MFEDLIVILENALQTQHRETTPAGGRFGPMGRDTILGCPLRRKGVECSNSVEDLP